MLFASFKPACDTFLRYSSGIKMGDITVGFSHGWVWGGGGLRVSVVRVSDQSSVVFALCPLCWVRATVY